MILGNFIGTDAAGWRDGPGQWPTGVHQHRRQRVSSAGPRPRSATSSRATRRGDRWFKTRANATIAGQLHRHRRDRHGRGARQRDNRCPASSTARTPHRRHCGRGGQPHLGQLQGRIKSASSAGLDEQHDRGQPDRHRRFREHCLPFGESRAEGVFILGHRTTRSEERRPGARATPSPSTPPTGWTISTGSGNQPSSRTRSSRGGTGDRADQRRNNNQPAPTLTSAVTAGGSTTFTGTIAGTGTAPYTIQFFANPLRTNAQGQQFLGQTTVNANGTFSATVPTPSLVGTVLHGDGDRRGQQHLDVLGAVPERRSW